MKDNYAVLYEKILSNQDWEIDDLDNLLQLAKDEGYVCGRLAMRDKASKAFRKVLGNPKLFVFNVPDSKYKELMGEFEREINE